MRNIYYGRISTASQKLDRQLSNDVNLKFSDRDIFTDTISGSKSFSKRPEGSKILDLVRSNKVASLTVHSLDRFGRNLADVQNTLEVLKEFNVNFISIKEGISTLDENGKPNKINELLFIVLGWFADFELERITERRKEGIDAYRLKGGYKVMHKREAIPTDVVLKQYAGIVELLGMGKSPTEIHELTGKSRSTIYKVKKLLPTVTIATPLSKADIFEAMLQEK